MNNDFFTDQGELMGLGTPGTTASKGSRAEFQKHFGAVPAHIQEELSKGNLRLGDQVIYSIKPVGASTTIKMFETQDDKKTGLRNISNAKLQKNQALLVSGIYLMAGIAPSPSVGGAPTDNEIMATPFQPLSATASFASLLNGEFDLKANKVQLVPETSNRLFANDWSGMWPVGFYKLHNPRLIQDDVQIEATVQLGTVVGIPANTYLFLGLFGTITTP